MNRIKRLSFEVLEKHKSKFGENFTENKKLLGELAIIRSKGLKNEIAGYITKFIKKETVDRKIKQSKIDASKDESAPIEESTESKTTDQSEENVIEVGADPPNEPETNESSEEKTE